MHFLFHSLSILSHTIFHGLNHTFPSHYIAELECSREYTFVASSKSFLSYKFQV